MLRGDANVFTGEKTATTGKQLVQLLVSAGLRAREEEAGVYGPRAHAIGDLVQESLRNIAEQAEDGTGPLQVHLWPGIPSCRLSSESVRRPTLTHLSALCL